MRPPRSGTGSPEPAGEPPASGPRSELPLPAQQPASGELSGLDPADLAAAGPAVARAGARAGAGARDAAGADADAGAAGRGHDHGHGCDFDPDAGGGFFETAGGEHSPGRGLGSQLRRSVFRHGCADTPANRLLAVLSNLWLHVHPARVPRESLRFRLTFCAGGLSLLFFVVTVATGLLLMVHYRPSITHAHGDVLGLTQAVPLGAFLRSLHRYAGDGMVIAVLVHLLRVLLSGSYRPPRELNWVIGVLLMALTLGIAFTGYLLPYDQKGYWATTVASQMVASTPLVGADGPGARVGPSSDLRALLLGGAEIGPAAILRFYVLHCVILPLLAAMLMALHFWRVRKDGFSGGL